MIRDPSDGSVKPALPTFRDLRRKHGPNWGLDPGPVKAASSFKAMTKEELAEHYSKHGLLFTPKQETGGE